MKTTAFALLVLLRLAMPAAQAQYVFTTNAGAVTMTGYTGSGGVVNIPETISGLPVSSIADFAFFNSVSPVSVTIPESVTTIGSGAFENCVNLASATIPGGLGSIADATFYGCISLTNVVIADGVGSFGEASFQNDSSLKSITIPGSVTNIGAGAFHNCGALTSVYFGGNAPSADASVFVGDANATVYYLPGTAGWAATFAGVPALVLIPTIPKGSLEVSILPAGAAAAGAQWQVDGGTFQNSGATVSNLSLGGHSVSFSSIIGWAAPTNETVSVSANLTVTAMGTYVSPPQFACTTNNGSIDITGYTGSGGVVNIPSTITGLPVASIGTNAFVNNLLITSVVIPNGVTNIGDAAFAGCGLTNVTIPASVSSIGADAFGFCTSLSAINVDAQNPVYAGVNGVLFQKDQTTLIQFPGGRGGSYTISNGVTSIGKGAFVGCGLTNVTVPASVTNIGNISFGACRSLATVTIGAGVTSIGADAFQYCTGLTSVYFQGNAPSADSTVFANDTDVTVYHLPGTFGWGATFAGVPVVLFGSAIQTGDGNFGFRGNQFGFDILGTSNSVVLVEAAANLANPLWIPLQTIILTNGLFHFSDLVQSNGPGRFYRLSPP